MLAKAFNLLGYFGTSAFFCETLVIQSDCLHQTVRLARTRSYCLHWKEFTTCSPSAIAYSRSEQECRFPSKTSNFAGGNKLRGLAALKLTSIILTPTFVKLTIKIVQLRKVMWNLWGEK